MNIKKIASIIIGIVLLNLSLYTLIPLTGIGILISLVGAAALLLMDSAKGGIIGKASLILGIIIGIYALTAVLGIGIPFIYFIQKYVYTSGGVLLIINPFINF